MFRDITAPYHFLESWFYDRAVAPAIAEMLDERHEILGAVLDAMSAEGRLLDVGCGGGHLLISLSRSHPGWMMTGLDLSPDQVRRARKRANGPGGQISFISGSALDMPFDADSFDAVISVCSIKHWPLPARGLEECLRVLRPGGALLVIEVNRDYRREDGRDFVRRQKVPRLLKPAAMAGFRWKIAARSLSIHDAKPLFSALPLSDITASALPGMPLWMVTARKRISQDEPEVDRA